MNSKTVPIEKSSFQRVHLSFSLTVVGLFFLTLFMVVTFPVFVFGESEIISNVSENIQNLNEILENSDYSAFQKRMIFNKAREIIEKGLDSGDIHYIITHSVENNMDAYSVKKIFDLLLSNESENLNSRPMVNKIKEGLAKRVDDTLIIGTLIQRSEQIRTANQLIEKNRLTMEEEEKDKMVDVLSDTLNNGVPASILDQMLQLSHQNSRSLEEVLDTSKELSSLGLKAFDLGMDSDQINQLFDEASNNAGENGQLESICITVQENLVAFSSAKIVETYQESRYNKKDDRQEDSSIISDIEISEPTEQEPGDGSTPESDDSGVSPEQQEDTQDENNPNDTPPEN
jgi:hypothetical protein